MNTLILKQAVAELSWNKRFLSVAEGPVPRLRYWTGIYLKKLIPASTRYKRLLILMVVSERNLHCNHWKICHFFCIFEKSIFKYVR